MARYFYDQYGRLRTDHGLGYTQPAMGQLLSATMIAQAVALATPPGCPKDTTQLCETYSGGWEKGWDNQYYCISRIPGCPIVYGCNNCPCNVCPPGMMRPDPMTDPRYPGRPISNKQVDLCPPCVPACATGYLPKSRFFTSGEACGNRYRSQPGRPDCVMCPLPPAIPAPKTNVLSAPTKVVREAGEVAPRTL